MGEGTNKHESLEENELSPITLLAFTCIRPTEPAIYLVREVCLFVCLFISHSLPHFSGQQVALSFLILSGQNSGIPGHS